MTPSNQLSEQFKEVSRRQIVASGGLFITAGLAGCLGSGTTDNEATQTTVDEPPEALQIHDRALSSAFPFELVDPEADVENVGNHVTGEPLVAHAQYHDPRGSFGTHWHFDPLLVPNGETRRLRARFVYTDYSAVALTDDSRYRLRVSTPSDANTEVVDVTVNADIVSFSGESIGTTQRIFELWDTAGEIVQWATPPLEIVVNEQ